MGRVASMLPSQSTDCSRSENPRRNGLCLSWWVSLVSMFLVISELAMRRRCANSSRAEAAMKLSISWLGTVLAYHLAWTATRSPECLWATRSIPISGPQRSGLSSQSQTFRDSCPKKGPLVRNHLHTRSNAFPLACSSWYYWFNRAINSSKLAIYPLENHLVTETVRGSKIQDLSHIPGRFWILFP